MRKSWRVQFPACGYFNVKNLACPGRCWWWQGGRKRRAKGAQCRSSLKHFERLLSCDTLIFVPLHTSFGLRWVSSYIPYLTYLQYLLPQWHHIDSTSASYSIIEAVEPWTLPWTMSRTLSLRTSSELTHSQLIPLPHPRVNHPETATLFIKPRHGSSQWILGHGHSLPWSLSPSRMLFDLPHFSLLAESPMNQLCHLRIVDHGPNTSNQQWTRTRHSPIIFAMYFISGDKEFSWTWRIARYLHGSPAPIIYTFRPSSTSHVGQLSSYIECASLNVVTLWSCDSQRITAFVEGRSLSFVQLLSPIRVVISLVIMPLPCRCLIRSRLGPLSLPQGDPWSMKSYSRHHRASWGQTICNDSWTHLPDGPIWMASKSVVSSSDNIIPWIPLKIILSKEVGSMFNHWGSNFSGHVRMVSKNICGFDLYHPHSFHLSGIPSHTFRILTNLKLCMWSHDANKDTVSIMSKYIAHTTHALQALVLNFVVEW